MGRVRPVVMFTDAERVEACRALIRRASGQGPPMPQAVVGAAMSICDCEDLTDDRMRKLDGLRQLFEDDEEIAPFLGVSRAAVMTNLSSRLSDIDLQLRSRILAIADKTLRDSANAINVEIESRVDRSKLSTVERLSFDTQPLGVFLAGIGPAARARLTRDEEELAAGFVDVSAEQIEEILEEGSAMIIAALSGAVTDSSRVSASHELDRGRAVELFRRALLAMVLGRLGRATEDPDGARVLTDAVTPEGVARDVLEVAGGAVSSPEGGLIREAGRPLTTSGELTRGANFAQGHTVVLQIQEEQPALRAVRVFRHSGKADPRTAHKDADGKTEEQLGGSVFPGLPDCGCRWEIYFEEQAA